DVRASCDLSTPEIFSAPYATQPRVRAADRLARRLRRARGACGGYARRRGPPMRIRIATARCVAKHVNPKALPAVRVRCDAPRRTQRSAPADTRQRQTTESARLFVSRLLPRHR